MIWRASGAAFTATTTNSGNSFGTGTVILSDNNGSAAALINVSNLKPGSTGSACMRVIYTGSLAADIRAYASASTDPDAIGSYLTISVDVGDIPSAGTDAFGVCTNFDPTPVNLFNSTFTSLLAKNSWANGMTGWTPATGTTRDYRVTYTLSSSAPNATMGKTATLQLTWEARNT